MSLINVRCVRWGSAVAWLLIAGCATQESILPRADARMVDIYREAMATRRGQGIPTFSPAAICASLTLKETIETCEATLEQQAIDAYQQVDARPAKQPLDYAAYTRSVDAELVNLFPRHDNPDIRIYVYPHLATPTRAPIPGYTSVIPLFERVEYRLPGEAVLPTPAPLSPVKANAE